MVFGEAAAPKCKRVGEVVRLISGFLGTEGKLVVERVSFPDEDDKISLRD